MFPFAAIGWWILTSAAPVTATEEPRQDYEVRFVGVPARSLRRRLLQISDAVKMRAYPPPSNTILLRRAEGDAPRIRDLLHSEGYLEALARVEVWEGPPRLVVFRIHSGPRYRLGRLSLHLDPLHPPKGSKIGFHGGMPFESREILQAEKRLIDYIRTRGYPFPVLTNRVYRADPANARVHVSLAVDTRTRARFGPTTVGGTQQVSQAVVRHARGWRTGDTYNAARVNDTRTSLVRSGLFASVDIDTGTNVPPDGLLPVHISVRERKHRTVQVGVSYHTDKGPSSQALWENRNLFGKAERLTARIDWGRDESQLEIAFRQPRLTRRNQSLLIMATRLRETTDAYESDHARLLGSLSRTVRGDWKAETGLALHTLRDVDRHETLRHKMLSLPASLAWGRSDDLLDPTHGVHLSLAVEPFLSIDGQDSHFVKNEIAGRVYQPLDSRGARVLALRLRAGGLFGEQRFDLPPSERFYAGGGQSVRGYAYQSIGPMRADNPVGGRSVMDGSFEFRTRIGDRTGAVAFIDAGSVGSTQFPRLKESLYWGAGLGLRFYTPIGPLRMDGAVPLNRRENVDNPFQFYVSIGQSF